jgi:predicted nuclease of predicted toxin-antitoxin system
VAIPGLSARLYTDHHVDGRLAPDLRESGFDALTAREAGKSAASDEEQLEFAASEGRALLTHDIGDFADLARRWYLSGRHHASIVISGEIKGARYGELLRRVIRLLDAATADELADTVRHLEEFR